MSIICKDCGGIFKNPCITFYNNFNNNFYNQHFQIDNYGTLLPVYHNFLGFDCWLNDTDTTFNYQPTIKLLHKLLTISQKTITDKQIFTQITQYLNHTYIINLNYGIQLLNHQLSNNRINLHGHILNFTGNILKWVPPIIYNSLTNFNHPIIYNSLTTFNPSGINTIKTKITPITHKTSKKNFKKSSLKSLLSTIHEEN